MYDKRYFERYALLSVCHMFNYDIERFMKCCEKPDLQSEEYDIGIEVTQSITEHDGTTIMLINSYFGRGLSGNEILESIHQANKKNKFKGSCTIVDDVAIISPTKGLYDSSKHRELIIRSIIEKSEKFSGYKHFRINGLYCFAHTGLIDESDYPCILDACRNSAFSLVLINCIDRILHWNALYDSFLSYDISYDLLTKWKKEALQ